MSNYLSIAAVTATLRRVLQSSLVEDIAGGEATAVRPDNTTGDLPSTGVNIFLFQVSPNTAWWNEDLPTRNPAGQPVQRPRIALDLHYLLTFYGDDLLLEPQRVMGSVVRTLHARPVLTQAAIRDTLADPSFSYVADSNLAEEVERVKFTPVPLSLEELSRLWSVYYQTPYSLSLVYQGGVVLIEEDLSPRRALPVLVPQVTAFPLVRAVITSAVASEGDQAPVIIGGTLLLKGNRLGGTVSHVRLGEATVTPESVGVSEISVVLDDPSLRAGVQGVKVIYASGGESNVVPVVLRPRIEQNPGGSFQISVQDVVINPEDSTRSATVVLTLVPVVGARQPVMLYLNGLNPSPGSETAYSFPAEPRLAEGSVVTFLIDGVLPGTYLVRVQVSDAESVVTMASGSEVYNIPSVVIP